MNNLFLYEYAVFSIFYVLISIGKHLQINQICYKFFVFELSARNKKQGMILFFQTINKH